MECYLHIGTEKTATTSIQNFLDLNRVELWQKDFLFTKSLGKSNNRKLPVLAYNPNRRDDFTRMLGISSDFELLRYQKKTILELKDEIRSWHTRNQNLKIVFSSEHLQSRLTTIKEIQRLKRVLFSVGIKNIKIVIYLRNPAEIANSLYSTAIKYGSLEECPPPPSNHYYENICNHGKTLEQFESVFGEGTIRPRIFHKNEFRNGSIIDDFMNCMELPLDESYEIPPNVNEGLSIIGLNILRRINKTIPLFIDGKRNLVRANIVSFFEKSYSKDKYIMPEHIYEQYDLAFKESNQWVREKYFPEKTTLFPDSQHPIESKLGVSEKSLDEFATLVSNMWIAKQNKILSKR